MDPRRAVATIASGLSLALLTASILRHTRSPEVPRGAESFLQLPPRSATTRGSTCRQLYGDGFYNTLLAMSPDVGCRPQLPTEKDCADLQEKLGRKSRQTSCSHLGCVQDQFVSVNSRKPLKGVRSSVIECEMPKGSLHCWRKLTKHWFHYNKPKPMDNCIMIYPSSATPSTFTDTSPHLSAPILPSISPTSFPSISTSSNHAPLMTHPFIYSAGVVTLAGIFPRLAPLPTDTNSSYIYLTCNSSQHDPANTPAQRLIVVNLGRLSAQQKDARSFPGTPHVKVTILPSVSRAAFYRNYPVSAQTLQEMEKAQGAAMLDFPMHQASGEPQCIKTFMREFISQISDHLENGGIFRDKFPIFVNGISPCERQDTLRNLTHGELNEDTYTKSEYSLNHASAIGGFICSALQTEYSWWNSSKTIDLQKANEHISYLQVALSEHISKRGHFPVSLSVFHGPRKQPGSSREHLENYIEYDTLLASHIQQLGGSMSRTIHVIVSGGGTIYHPRGRYTSYTKIEESNPVLFFIIPQTARLLMPLNFLKNLKLNSHRLVATADMALTVLSLADLSTGVLPAMNTLSVGNTPISLILQEVPANRSCESLSIQTPHLCICEGEWTPADNDTMYVGLAELAVASLNRIIRQQAESRASYSRTLYSSSPYATCHKLIGISFYEVRVRREGAWLVTQMALIVAQKTLSGDARRATPLADSFKVTLGSDFSRQEVGEMRMLGYVRTSNVGGRRGCSVGTGVDPDLCLCVPGSHSHTETPHSILQHLQQTQFGVRPKLIHLHQPCLILSIRQYGNSDSVIFTAINNCDRYTYEVTLQVTAVSVILSQTNPNTVIVEPLREVTINVVMKVSYYSPPSKVGYQVSFTLKEQ